MTNHNFIKINGSTLMLILIFTFRISAQESLSLQQAIKIGLENNFSIQIEKQKQEQASNNNTLGEAGALPNINLNSSPSFNQSETNNPLSFGTGATDRLSINPSISASWVVFNGFNVRMTKEKLAYLEAQSDGNAAVIVENTIQAIILAYFNVLLESERTEVFKSTLKLSKDRYDYSKLKKELGSAVTFDILKDKNSYLTDSSSYISQIFNYKNAVRNLNLLLARNVNQRYKFIDILRVEKKNFSLDELSAKMTSNNNNLKNQFINQNIFKREISIAKSSQFPQISITASGSKSWQHEYYETERTSFLTGDKFSDLPSNSRNISANITLAFTLFNGGRIKNQIKNARIQERIGTIQIDQLKSTLQNNLINNFDQYNLRKSLMGISDENLNTAQLNLQLAEDRYKNGSITSFDYRTIQITYLQTALTFYQSIYNLIDTEIELLRLSGGLMEVYK